MAVDRHNYDMGLIGNCAYMAHIDKGADIRWMCWPKFDSSFIFGSLLDEEKGGHFYIRPKSKNWTSKQYYLPNTNILCTEFNGEDGRFQVVDFAPRFYQYERMFKPLMLFRRVEPLEGNPEIVVSCEPVGAYGEKLPESYIGSNHIRYLGLKRPVRLTSSFPLSFVLSKRPVVLNKTKHLALSWGIPLEAPLESTGADFFRKTKQYWQGWINQSTICNFHQDAVIRSVLALKLHQFQDTGGIIAAGTTSLPEHPNEGRNWDYRFCWLRDAYYTLRALNNIGHFDELRHYSNYIQNLATQEDEHYSPVYSIIGGHNKLEERQLPLQGYKDNKPVRIGNAAYKHIQNDVYGQILVALLPLYTDQRFAEKDEHIAKKLTHQLLDKIDETMDMPDAGLWEFRNAQYRHCYTFLFHWAGANAGRKIAQYFKDKQLVKKAQKLIERATHNIEKCYNEKEGVYQQSIETDNLDASLLKLIIMNYLDPNSKKAHSHLKQLEKELKIENGLFYRYKHADDFGTPNSAFLVCAFWYVEALACVGRVNEAIQHFEHLLQYGNHLGLFSEDIDPKTGSQWGNFPQTYSHVGIVNAAFRIANKLDRPDFLQ